jgi:hypothetical protein
MARAGQSNEDAMESMQTETPGKLATLAKCAHAGCICTVSSGEQFCSDYCASQAGEHAAGEGDCGCGHAECTAKAAEPLVPVAAGTS